MKKLKLLVALLAIVFSSNKKYGQDSSDYLVENALNGFEFRSIGPAFMSGRIADIAINPSNENNWYVAVGSGGTWKTENAGTTWIPLTDDESFYSTGCITIDPNNHDKIWLGTGENVGGRHVGIGHGIFVSHDSGDTWTDMGLNESEHISKIIVHPDNSNIIWVASQGPLWNSGGDRGLFKSIDGGKTWSNKLYVNEWTGVTDLLIDPKNPNVLYAATWQRHRNVAALIDGGPGTSIYKSLDGGDNWEKIDSGLPSSNMGKIGLAISPMKPNVIYAAIELDRRNGAVYRSENSGGTWIKMSNTVSGGTGPHYYQELVASPFVFDKIYLMNVRVLVSENGGKDFYTMKEKKKHSDNHSLTFKADDPNYMLIGTDGGIYESFDDSETWKFVANLPLTQFYKLAIDDDYPFYNIYGGTQDNNTQGGPSRNFKNSGISNADWYVVLGGDGHQPATEPGNPDIIYAQSQQGYINRIDMTNREIVSIRPQEDIDEPYERFNWDAPILVSHHDPKRLYFGSQRVWRSENRGDSWSTVSGDLTKDEERLSLPIMGDVQSFDNAWDVYAMSTYNTITSLSESKIDENILYVGTDDGIIQYTKNGGSSWTKLTVDKLPDTPKEAFVNDIKADLHNKDVAYVALDNHKFGDYKPYLFKTTDGGKKWTSITNGLPSNTIVWRIVQDHVNPNLLFLGTEYGVYVSLNQGAKWHKFSNGLPTISVRDMAIQKRENDLVIATFGRSFYVLDDYSPLRTFSSSSLESDAILFEPRKALQYNQIYGGTSSDGMSSYYAENPDYGANIYYYIKEGEPSLVSKRLSLEAFKGVESRVIEKFIESGLTTSKSITQKTVREIEDLTDLSKKEISNVKNIIEANAKKGVSNTFPGWEQLDEELNETYAKAVLIIKDVDGKVVKEISGPYSSGVHTFNWDLKTGVATTIMSGSSRSKSLNFNVKPGKYTLELYKSYNSELTLISEPVTLAIEKIRPGTLKNPMAEKHDAYYNELADLYKKVDYYVNIFENNNDKLNSLKSSLKYVKSNREFLEKEVFNLNQIKDALDLKLYGSSAKQEIGEKDYLTIYDRLSNARGGYYSSSYGPTELHMKSLDIAKEMFTRLKPELDNYFDLIVKVEKYLEEAGAPIVLD